MMFTLPDLPYSYEALEPYIDRETMHLHHDKHHAAYVTNLNETLKIHGLFFKMPFETLMKNLNQVPEAIRTKVRNNGGGVANHNLYWQIMSPAHGQEPKGKLLEAINKNFGNLSKFQEKFTLAGLGRFGSGWVWLVVDGGKLKIIDTPNQDTPVMEGKTPVLTFDVWEHAYYLKYQNRRADYIKAWWNVVNWKEVEGRFSELIG